MEKMVETKTCFSETKDGITNISIEAHHKFCGGEENLMFGSNPENRVCLMAGDYVQDHKHSSIMEGKNVYVCPYYKGQKWVGGKLYIQCG